MLPGRIDHAVSVRVLRQCLDSCQLSVQGWILKGSCGAEPRAGMVGPSRHSVSWTNIAPPAK